MRLYRWSIAGQAVLAGLMLGAASACAPSDPSVPTDQQQYARGETMNYIIALAPPLSAPSATDEAAAQLRAGLEADRDRILADSFGGQAPAPGASFVSAYAFEIRLTSEQAQTLAQHPDVVSVETDRPMRPMRAGAQG